MKFRPCHRCGRKFAPSPTDYHVHTCRRCLQRSRQLAGQQSRVNGVIPHSKPERGLSDSEINRILDEADRKVWNLP